MKLSSEELAKLCESYTGTIKRPMDKRYRYAAPSGRLVRPRHEAAPRYAKEAYRADKKRAGSCPRALWGGGIADVKVAASRDY